MPAFQANPGVRNPKHRQIFEHVRAAIVAGQYQAGNRMPSETVLGRRFDASRPTVARALHDLEVAGYVERRVGSGTYVRVRQEVGNRKFGLLIPGLGTTEIFEPICAEIARLMQAQNFTLLWGDSSPGPVEEANHVVQGLCERYVAEQVAGVFFAPIELTPGMDETNRQIAGALDGAGIPVILLDRDLEWFPRRSRFDLVGIDNRRVSFMLVEHLVGLGCRRVDFVARPGSAATVDFRIAGWREALLSHGIQPEATWLRRGEPSDLEFVRELIGPAPQAFLCANDFTAANLLQSLSKLGIHVPQDVAVVGIDDVKYASLLTVPLTTIRQPCRAIGRAAVAAMIQRIEDRTLPPRDILLDCKLVIRESCGATTADHASGTRNGYENEDNRAQHRT